jgi:hypothetical protein
VAAQDSRVWGPELAQGNLVLSVDGGRAALIPAKALAREVTGGEDSPALRAAGQSIRVVAPEGGQASSVVAYAHGRTIAASSLDDPALLAFLTYWLGRAAG